MSEEAKVLDDNDGDTKKESPAGGKALGNLISLRMAKLKRLQQRISKLRNEAGLEEYKEDLKECRSAFNEANTLIGDLNDAAGGQKSRS